jgi:hypothetical protein
MTYFTEEDPAQLELLANWLDTPFDSPIGEKAPVQRDLRRIAAKIRSIHEAIDEEEDGGRPTQATMVKGPDLDDFEEDDQPVVQWEPEPQLTMHHEFLVMWCHICNIPAWYSMHLEMERQSPHAIRQVSAQPVMGKGDILLPNKTYTARQRIMFNGEGRMPTLQTVVTGVE